MDTEQTMKLLRKHPVGRIVLGAFLVLVASLGACALFKRGWPEYDAYTTASGVWVQDTTVTEGRVLEGGETIEIHYTLALEDGTPVDSTHERGLPIEYTLGTLAFPQGFEDGLIGMRELGRRILRVPPDVGFGAAGVEGVVPPDATLVFDVELLRILAPESGADGP